MIEIKIQRGGKKIAVADTTITADTEITCIFNNESSVDVTKATFALSDDSGSGDPIVKEVIFGRIPSRTSPKMTTTLPTGVEKMIVVYYVDGESEPYTNFGFGNNAKLVRATLTD